MRLERWGIITMISVCSVAVAAALVLMLVATVAYAELQVVRWDTISSGGDFKWLCTDSRCSPNGPDGEHKWSIQDNNASHQPESWVKTVGFINEVALQLGYTAAWGDKIYIKKITWQMDNDVGIQRDVLARFKLDDGTWVASAPIVALVGEHIYVWEVPEQYWDDNIESDELEGQAGVMEIRPTGIGSSSNYYFYRVDWVEVEVSVEFPITPTPPPASSDFGIP